MKIALVPSPRLNTVDGKSVWDPYVPLGLLSVASILVSQDHDVRLIDVNRICKQGHNLKEVPELIMSENPDILGFSTMCDQYHLILKLASSCKKICPNTPIILGGPQATLTDNTTLTVFPFIDAIVCGESERNITQIIESLDNKEALKQIPGITFRLGEKIIKTSSSPPIMDLDSIPLPNYGLYPGLEELEVIPIEAGRGCPFACSFCSTSLFWQRTFRMRSSKKLIEQIKQLYEDYNFRRFSFIHDNLTNSSKNIFQLCDDLEKAKLGINWSCSARIDCLSGDVLQRMAKTGCKKIFLGIETGSQKMLQIINKKLDLQYTTTIFRDITNVNMSYTASFIMGFPEEQRDDLIETIELMMEAKFAGDGEEVVQLHMLAPSPKTPLYFEFKNTLCFDRNFSDHACPELTEEDNRLVIKYPEVFSALYYYDNPHVDRNALLQINYVFVCVHSLPYTFYTLWKEKQFGFPEKLIDMIISTDIVPNRNWHHDRHKDRINAVTELLEKMLSSLGMENHFIREVIRYEKAVNTVARVDIQSPLGHIEEFAYDIESYINKTTFGDIKEMPKVLPEDNHHLVFAKVNEKVATTRLPKKFTEIMGVSNFR